MPTTTLTAIRTGAGTGSPAFIDDATGQSCVRLGDVAPPGVDILNLTAVGHLFFWQHHNNLCQFVSGGNNNFIAANGTGHVNLVAGSVGQAGITFVAQDVQAGTYRFQITWAEPLGPCAFGTERKPLVDPVVIITPELVSLVLAEYPAVFLAVIFVILYFISFDVDSLCGSGPPAMPTIDNSTPLASFQTIFRIWQVVAWFHFCQCKPGTPTPVLPPKPPATQPTGWLVAPTFTCNGADLCATLILMQKQLASLSTGLGAVNQLVTLLQRYSLPFAYISGAIHSAIASPTSFAISRLVGVRVHITARPAELQTFTGIPQYVTDLGWLSIVTGDGLIDEIRLTRDDQTWFPRLMPLAVTMGVAVREGVTVAVQELQAEP